MFKSLLILLGVGIVLPWPGQWFEQWHRLALPFPQALLVLLIWTAVIIPVYFLLTRQARLATLQGAQPAEGTVPRLVLIYERVLESYRLLPCLPCSDDLCCISERKLRPCLLVSGRIPSPLALTGGENPSVLFPAGLVERLTDAELAGALAHELAHFYMRRPNWCSVGTLQTLTLISPVASLVGEYLTRQEEKACDELAVSVVGQPELYAGMLTRSFRFAKEQAVGPAMRWSRILPHLLGFKPLLSERVEHLLQPEKTRTGWKQSRIILWLVWAALFSVLFLNYSAIPS